MFHTGSPLWCTNSTSCYCCWIDLANDLCCIHGSSRLLGRSGVTPCLWYRSEKMNHSKVKAQEEPFKGTWISLLTEQCSDLVMLWQRIRKKCWAAKKAKQQKSQRSRLQSESTVLRIWALRLSMKKISLRGWNSHLLVMENMFASHGHTAVHWGAFVLSTECCTLHCTCQ